MKPHKLTKPHYRLQVRRGVASGQLWWFVSRGRSATAPYRSSARAIDEAGQLYALRRPLPFPLKYFR